MTARESNTEKGRNFEKQIFDRERMHRPELKFERDAAVALAAGGLDRQIDVHNVTEAEIVECKCLTRPVGVNYVDALVTVRNDLGAKAARLVSASGFTGPARTLAAQHGIVCQKISYADKTSRENDAEWYPPDAPRGAYRGDFLDGHYGPPITRIVFDNGDPQDVGFPLFVYEHLRWGDQASNRAAAVAILGHQLQDSPSNARVAAFVEEFCGDWDEGYGWKLPAPRVRDWLGL